MVNERSERIERLALIIRLLYRNRGGSTKQWLAREVHFDGIDIVELSKLLDILIIAKLVIEHDGTYQITSVTIDLMAQVIGNSSIPEGDK